MTPAERPSAHMLRLDLDAKASHDASGSPRAEIKDDSKASPLGPVSAMKRKLLEAKQKDAYFDQESKAIETNLIVKEVSKRFVADALTTSFSLITPRRDERDAKK